MLADYPGVKLEMFKWFMDDVTGATSCSEQELQQFLQLPPTTIPVSADKLLFLDIYMIPWDNHIAALVYYKNTDSYSYLDFRLSHPSKCNSSIPYSHIPMAVKDLQ